MMVRVYILSNMEFLVISPTGNQSELIQIVNSDSNFDVALLCYEDIPKDIEKRAKYVKYYRKEKWEMISLFFSEHPELIKEYSYFWFVDDDIITDTKSINMLFKIAKDFSLKLSQPSVSGFTSFDICRKKTGSFLRFTNFVEIMCPIMSSDTLEKLYSSFRKTSSGWGLDIIWRNTLNDYEISIIDHINVKHKDKVRSKYGNRFKIDPKEELKKVLEEYNDTLKHKNLSTVHFYSPAHSDYLL